MVELKDHLTQVDLTYKTCADSRALEGRLTALLDRCGQEHGSSSVPYASLLGELGGFYRGQGRFDEAEARFRQALALLETDPGRDSPEYATMLNNLAGVHRLQGRQEEALALQEGAARDCFEQAAQAAGELYGPGHYEVRAALDHRALAQSRLEERQ